MCQCSRQVEIDVMTAVGKLADRLQGSRKPEWYLGACLDQILDDKGVTDWRLRDDLAPRAAFILRSFAAMKRPQGAPAITAEEELG